MEERGRGRRKQKFYNKHTIHTHIKSVGNLLVFP